MGTTGRWLTGVRLASGVVSAAFLFHAADVSTLDRGTKLTISPEATKALTPQSDDRGRLMPLHLASVMEWLCGDGNVQAEVGGDRKACYAQMRPGMSDCAAQFHDQLPVGRSKAAATGKPDIVTFRKQLRACLQQNYLERATAAGKAVVAPTAVAVDPLAAGMGGGQ